MNKCTRRQFLSYGATAAGAAMAGRPLRALVATVNTQAAASVAVTPTIRTFDYNQVELLEGPMRQQFDTNHAFFLKMDEDRLLKPFRQAAGLPAPGDDMGGWYDIDRYSTRKGVFTGSFPGTALDNIFPGWRGRTRSPAQSPRRRRCDGWWRALRPL